MAQKTLRSVLIKPAGPDCNFGCAYCFYKGKAAMFGSKSKHRISSAMLEVAIGQVMDQSPERVAVNAVSTVPGYPSGSLMQCSRGTWVWRPLSVS
jgi:sulfatase maturation enzyme AslB (radical SAM superfamily)